MKIQNWIFVTGAPRSGTTFVGKILSAPISVDYIHEPFNPDCGIPGIDQRFLYLRPDGNSNQKQREIAKNIFSLKFSLKTGYYKKDAFWTKTLKSVIGSRGPFYLRIAKLNPFHTSAVIKDPIGCLSTEYLAKNFGVKPVVMIRHPVSFVASTMRLGWELDLTPICAQGELVDDFFSDETEFLQAKERSTLQSSAALWRALNKVLLMQAENNPRWHVVTHEQLCASPVKTFRELYGGLGLPWSSGIERLIVKKTESKNRASARPGRVQEFSRDSAAIFKHSINTLSAEQRKEIYDITEDVAQKFYSRESFML
ncbi:MAG: sulfotransferase family protein [bacterium]|nr:MAG: sulfotransferase family protein [bacterium]